MKRRDKEISCPNCGTKVSLKFLKKDGIQCKKCYYWIPNAEIDRLLIEEQELIVVGEPVEQEELKETTCPECGATITYTRIVDGGIMCKKCYSWIAIEEEEEEEEQEKEVVREAKRVRSRTVVKTKAKSDSPNRIEKPYIIGEKLEDLPEPEKKIPIIPVLGNEVISGAQLAQIEISPLRSSDSKPESWDKPKPRSASDVPPKITPRPISDRERKKKMSSLFRSRTFDIKRIIRKRPESNKLPPRKDTTTMDVSPAKREPIKEPSTPKKRKQYPDKDTTS